MVVGLSTKNVQKFCFLRSDIKNANFTFFSAGLCQGILVTDILGPFEVFICIEYTKGDWESSQPTLLTIFNFLAFLLLGEQQRQSCFINIFFCFYKQTIPVFHNEKMITIADVLMTL